MSFTIQERLDRVKVYLNQYLPLQKLDDDFIIKKIERSRDSVWRGVILGSDFLFRTTATLADGDTLPADYVASANNVHKVISAVDTPFTFVNIQEIGLAFNNAYGKGTSTKPKYFFSDGKFHTIPASITGVTFEYIVRPAALEGQPLSTTDDMPEYTEDMIIRGATARLLSQLVGDPETLKVAGVNLADAQKAAQQFYLDYYQKNIINGGGIELTD